MSGNISRLAMVWVLALSVSVGRTLGGSSCPIQLNGPGRIRPKAHLARVTHHQHALRPCRVHDHRYASTFRIGITPAATKSGGGEWCSCTPCANPDGQWLVLCFVAYTINCTARVDQGPPISRRRMQLSTVSCSRNVSSICLVVGSLTDDTAPFVKHDNGIPKVSCYRCGAGACVARALLCAAVLHNLQAPPGYPRPISSQIHEFMAGTGRKERQEVRLG